MRDSLLDRLTMGLGDRRNICSAGYSFQVLAFVNTKSAPEMTACFVDTDYRTSLASTAPEAICSVKCPQAGLMAEVRKVRIYQTNFAH